MKTKPFLLSIFFLSWNAFAKQKNPPTEGTIEFIRIVPGTFTMGEVGETVEVTITKGFDIGKNEVTQYQWYEVTRENPSFFKEKEHCPEEGEHRVIGGIPMCSDYPVESVSWNDIVAVFLPTLNKRKGLTNCNGEYNDPSGCFRLPTEAEWEYATRASSKSKYYWGEVSYEIDRFAWQFANSGGRTHEVASRIPNRWGLHDTAGNVWEFVQDHWDWDDYSLPGKTNPVRRTGKYRIVRGGAWDYYDFYCSSAYRGIAHPTEQNPSYGFRLVRNL